MDTFEFKPTEDFTLAKATAGGEAEALAGATFEPAAFVEGTGEVQPAEALQVSLEAVVASLPTDVESSPSDLPGKDGPSGPGPGKTGIPGPGEVTEETEIQEIPRVGIVPGMYEAETIVKDLPPREEETPIPMHVDMEEVVTKPPSEVIVQGGLPMGSVPGDETGGESEPAAADDAKEWGWTSTPTVRAEAGAEAAIPTDLPREGAVIPPTLPGREAGRGVGETPLPEAGRVEFTEQPERLDARLPDSREPLTGVGARGNVDATQGFGTELPLGIPEIDVMPGQGGWGMGTPIVYGNMPGRGGMPSEGRGNMPGGGQTYGSGDIPVAELEGLFPGMPTSGGPSSSGSGPAIRVGMGGKADPVEEAAKAAVKEIKVALSPVITTSEDQCGTAADYAVELCKFLDSNPERKGSTSITFTCVGATKNSSGKLDYYEYEIKANSYTYDIKRKSQEPDDSNPHPYTGGSMGPVLPEKDNDTGKVLPDADLEGFDGTVWKATRTSSMIRAGSTVAYLGVARFTPIPAVPAPSTRSARPRMKLSQPMMLDKFKTGMVGILNKEKSNGYLRI